ncbi:MAG: waaA [Rickettsiaceae bacterium]|jgi:3-deoxy-D-manno-octulosonic-acid transferase|nr:waaA [Rickettsiaceae bacterium]
MLLTFYRILTIIAFPVIYIIIQVRKIVGKEDKTRFRERFGLAAIKRVEGYMIWIHAASVGESLSALPLIERLTAANPKITILLTTGTVSSTKVIVDRLPASVVHQYIVVDSYFCVRRFLNHWQPDLAIFIESELWPNLLIETAKTCPLLLLNARMSDRSFKKWSILKSLASSLLSQFSLIITQSKQDLDKYRALGAQKLKNAGNIKYANINTSFDQYEYDKLYAQIKDRTVWLAASTHQADEEPIYKTHLALKKIFPNLLTILAPRHPVRTSIIIDRMLVHPIKFVCRTNLESIKADTDIYLANTLGEMNLFYSLASAIFIGGSFANGGHNPIEAANFNKPIIVGPNMSNFKEIAEEFLKNGAVIQITSTADLVKSLQFLLDPNNIKETKTYSMNAAKIIKEHRKVLEEYLKLITQYIP